MMLVQAASGLENLMAGQVPGVLKDSTVAQVSAYIYYQSNVIAKLTTNKEFQSKFTKTIFDQINADFGEYIDAIARSRPRNMHHVYEWKKVGNPSGRLFKLNVLSTEGLSFRLGFEFKPSRSIVPSSNSRRRHTFPNKASVMEAGIPLKISPRNAERLVFEYNGETVFMPKGKSVTVNRPGGSGVKNQFVLAYSRFFNGQLVNNSIKKSRFQQIFNSGLVRAMRLPVGIKKVQYKFYPKTLLSQADSALSQAYGSSL